MRNSKMSIRRFRRDFTAPFVPKVAEPEPAAAEAADAFGSDPAMSHFLPLDDFDNDELDPHTPEEWVQMGLDQGGTPARSKFYVDDCKWTWLACRLPSRALPTARQPLFFPKNKVLEASNTLKKIFVLN